MRPESEMLSAVVTTWMLAAVSCAALPFVWAVPRLQAAGELTPLLAALLIGAAVSVPLSLAARRLADLGHPPEKKNWWGTIAPGQAALFGAIGWGVPVGLIFSLNEFLGSSDVFVVIPGLAIWPLAGIAFGLTMRWITRRGDRGIRDA